jgi:hypothetical protein
MHLSNYPNRFITERKPGIDIKNSLSYAELASKPDGIHCTLTPFGIKATGAIKQQKSTISMPVVKL